MDNNYRERYEESMTREEVEKCSKWEQQFIWAVRTNFVHLSQSDFNEIAKLYKDIMGVTLSKSQKNCNTCRLNALKTLGAEYLKWRDDYIRQDREAEKDEEQPKKKGGRPKKINIDG